MMSERDQLRRALEFLASVQREIDTIFDECPEVTEVVPLPGQDGSIHYLCLSGPDAGL